MRHHFFVDPEDIAGEVVTLSEPESHHAARSLRVRPGEAISVADGSGRLIEAVVTRIGPRLEAEIAGVREAVVPRPAVCLMQAVAKHDRMDACVQKAVEVGVRRIVPFIAERTVVRWEADKRWRVVERWRAVSLAAAKQCASPWPVPVDEILDAVPTGQLSGQALVLDVHVSTRLREVLCAQAPEVVTLVVGPEGGLSGRELDALRASGAEIVTLGERILRTETAGPVASALIAYAYGNLG